MSSVATLEGLVRKDWGSVQGLTDFLDEATTALLHGHTNVLTQHAQQLHILNTSVLPLLEQAGVWPHIRVHVLTLRALALVAHENVCCSAHANTHTVARNTPHRPAQRKNPSCMARVGNVNCGGSSGNGSKGDRGLKEVALSDLGLALSGAWTEAKAGHHLLVRASVACGRLLVSMGRYEEAVRYATAIVDGIEAQAHPIVAAEFLNDAYNWCMAAHAHTQQCACVCPEAPSMAVVGACVDGKGYIKHAEEMAKRALKKVDGRSDVKPQHKLRLALNLSTVYTRRVSHLDCIHVCRTALANVTSTLRAHPSEAALLSYHLAASLNTIGCHGDAEAVAREGIEYIEMLTSPSSSSSSPSASASTHTHTQTSDGGVGSKGCAHAQGHLRGVEHSHTHTHTTPPTSTPPASFMSDKAVATLRGDLHLILVEALAHRGAYEEAEEMMKRAACVRVSPNPTHTNSHTNTPAHTQRQPDAEPGAQTDEVPCVRDTHTRTEVSACVPVQPHPPARTLTQARTEEPCTASTPTDTTTHTRTPTKSNTHTRDSAVDIDVTMTEAFEGLGCEDRGVHMAPLGTRGRGRKEEAAVAGGDDTYVMLDAVCRTRTSPQPDKRASTRSRQADAPTHTPATAAQQLPRALSAAGAAVGVMMGAAAAAVAEKALRSGAMSSSTASSSNGTASTNSASALLRGMGGGGGGGGGGSSSNIIGKLSAMMFNMPYVHSFHTLSFLDGAGSVLEDYMDFDHSGAGMCVALPSPTQTLMARACE